MLVFKILLLLLVVVVVQFQQAYLKNQVRYKDETLHKITRTCKNVLIRASVDALCRDGTSEISRDPRTKRLQTRRESLARPSKHTNNNF